MPLVYTVYLHLLAVLVCSNGCCPGQKIAHAPGGAGTVLCCIPPTWNCHGEVSPPSSSQAAAN